MKPSLMRYCSARAESTPTFFPTPPYCDRGQVERALGTLAGFMRLRIEKTA
jgi:hypothetical protein